MFEFKKSLNLVITTSKEIKIVVNQCKHCRLHHASLLLAADSNTRWCQYWYFYYLRFAFDAIYSSFFRFYVLDQYLNGTFLFLLNTQNIFSFFPPLLMPRHTEPLTRSTLMRHKKNKHLSFYLLISVNKNRKTKQRCY